jgi:hypothetical protein
MDHCPLCIYRIRQLIKAVYSVTSFNHHWVNLPIKLASISASPEENW